MTTCAVRSENHFWERCVLIHDNSRNDLDVDSFCHKIISWYWPQIAAAAATYADFHICCAQVRMVTNE